VTTWRPAAGPRRLPLAGNAAAFSRDPLRFFSTLRDQHGDVVSWRLGPKRCLFLSHPEHIAQLLTAREHGFETLDIGWAFKQVVGQSVIRSNGADWRRKRSLVQPAVRPRQVRHHATTMVACAEALADTWQDGQRVDLAPAMSRLTQRVVLRTLFGNDLPGSVEALGAAMAVAENVVGDELRRLHLFLPGWIHTPARRRLLAAVATIDAEIDRLITAHTQAAGTGQQREDLLARLLDARDEHDPPLSRREVRDEAVTLWAAGHETTSTALTWAWHALSGAPAARSRLDAELDQVLSGRAPTMDDYDQLTWTQQVLKEVLRLYPPAWIIAAVARPGAALGDARIRPGTIVWCSPWSVHRDPRWFSEPDSFQPQRWDAANRTAVPDHAWIPFGGGPRACIGARFAQVEATLLLATLGQRFHLDTTPRRVAARPRLLLQPAVPVHATLRRRA
jgi:cytochrome P450